MAFANLAVFGGAFFCPVVVGKITAELGWEWTFYFVAIFSGVCLIVVFLGCPEVAYRREDALNTDVNGSESTELPKHEVAAPASVDNQLETSHGFVFFPSSGALQPMGDARTPKKTFLESLSLFTGRKTNDRYWVLLLRPFPLLLNPAFVWGCLTQGTLIAWTVMIAVVNSALFIGGPYFWGEVKSGYTYTAPFLGSVVGFIIAGTCSDWSVKYMVKLNKGVYEPEFRIFVLSLWNLVIGGIGLYGFALTAGEVVAGRYTFWVSGTIPGPCSHPSADRLTAKVPITFFGFTVAATIIAAVVSSLYIVDAYSELLEGVFVLNGG